MMMMKSIIGPVSTWLSAMSGNIKDYEDFKSLFIKQYWNLSAQTQAWINIYQGKYTHGGNQVSQTTY
jgi:hypothetical protein